MKIKIIDFDYDFLHYITCHDIDSSNFDFENFMIIYNSKNNPGINSSSIQASGINSSSIPGINSSSIQASGINSSSIPGINSSSIPGINSSSINEINEDYLKILDQVINNFLKLINEEFKEEFK
ncbi:hypothetical protein TNCV_2563711 [Trichonephila clavipes]|nr:hypothetical protein TNCV_2563711 [Trichonephila clavipes]